MASSDPLHSSQSPDSGPFDPNIHISFEEYIAKSDTCYFCVIFDRWREIRQTLLNPEFLGVLDNPGNRCKWSTLNKYFLKDGNLFKRSTLA